MIMSLDKEDLKEIEDKLPELTNWLTNNFVNISSVCFILQTIMSEVNKVKKEINNE